MNDSLKDDISSSIQDYIVTRYLKTIIVYTCFVVGIIGNGVVILVYSRINKKQKRDGGKDYKTHMRYYIPILAVFDLATLVFGAISPVGSTDFWLCKGLAFLLFSAVRTSGLLLLLITIQRFMYIALFPQRVLTLRQLRISVVVVTVVGAIATLPGLFFEKIQKDNVREIYQRD